MRAVIATKNLTKYYGKTKGIENLNLEVNKGEIFGFLGPNGAGKTTTIRLLLNLIKASSGNAYVFGMDSQRDTLEIRRRLGYIPGEVAFYDGMNGKEFLSLMGSFHGVNGEKRIKKLKDMFELDLSPQIRAYSKGMKQKLAIIQAFMNDPELLILDEPSLGLDPLMQHTFYDLLLEEKRRGKTVFLSSHILPEVERVCDRVGIVRNGELVSIERVADLKRKKVRRIDIFLKKELTAEELKLANTEILEIKGKSIKLKFFGDTPKLLKQLTDLPIEDIAFPEASLEDTFMEFYGGKKK
jgi:ABC-2 type transport system ATP-binding protein